ncbi:MAG: hypothetical protein AAGF88_09820 [Pseudomonadota bacterium]
MSDHFDPERFRQEQEMRRMGAHDTSGSAVALAVVGIMVLGLLVFAFLGDSTTGPAELSQTATGTTALQD